VPFAVTNWPYSLDPRPASFGGVGWGFGAVPPWAWIMSTTNATGPWTSLNDGILVKTLTDDFTVTEWNGLNGGGTVLASVTKTGTQPPTSPTNSLRIVPRVVTIPPGRNSLSLVVLSYPFAVAVFGGFVMIDLGTGLPDVDLPDPVQIVPAIWDHDPL